MRPPAKTVDKYLAALLDDKRKALQKLRTLIKTAAPKAEETISWSMPMYKLNGQLVAFAAFNKHCTFFVCSGSYLGRHQKEFGDYSQTKSGIHFTPAKPLPVSVVKKIIKDRMAENAAKAKLRAKSK